MYIDIYGARDNAKCLITEHLRQRFKDWVVEFCQAKKFDGLLNFDFLVEDSTEEVICVGVKPNLDLSIIKRHTPEEVINAAIFIFAFYIYVTYFFSTFPFQFYFHIFSR